MSADAEILKEVFDKEEEKEDDDIEVLRKKLISLGKAKTGRTEKYLRNKKKTKEELEEVWKKTNNAHEEDSRRLGS